MDPPQSTFVPEYVEPTSAASSIISVREAAEHHQADSVAKVHVCVIKIDYCFQHIF